MPIRNINSIQIVVAYGGELGIDVDLLLQGSGLVNSQLTEHDLQVEDKQELHVLKNLMTNTTSPFRVGMELGSRYHLTSYGIMGYALLASSTPRKAVELGLRFLDLTYVYSKIELIEINQDLSLRFSCDIAGELGTLILARDMMGAAIIQREVFESGYLPINLQFTSPQPLGLSLDIMQQILGAEIQFDANYNGIVWVAEQMDLPLVKANAATAKICEQQCSQLLQQKQNWKPIERQVKDTLLHLGLSASMQDIADHLSRTTRTLHRQLKQEQTSWRQVRDNVRIGIAEELLSTPMQLDEIADRLGFSDSANFSHSFKRCRNITPSQHRKQTMHAPILKRFR
jgi:AraC-like DNA-binding protein